MFSFGYDSVASWLSRKERGLNNCLYKLRGTALQALRANPSTTRPEALSTSPSGVTTNSAAAPNLKHYTAVPCKLHVSIPQRPPTPPSLHLKYCIENGPIIVAESANYWNQIILAAPNTVRIIYCYKS